MIIYTYHVLTDGLMCFYSYVMFLLVGVISLFMLLYYFSMS